MKFSLKTISNQQFVVVNISDGFANWSQRKSQYVYKRGNVEVGASWWCNVHAYTDALQIAGYSLYSDKYPELPRYPDKLCKFACEDEEVDEYFKKKAFSCWKLLQDAKNGVVSKEEFNKNGLMPVNIHDVLCFAVNKFVGGPNADYGDICTFDADTKVDTFFEELLRYNRPIVTSGSYGNLGGHIVALVGVAYKVTDEIKKVGYSGDDLMEFFLENKYEPDFAIVDDPWGDMNRKDYRGAGNDVYVPWSKFLGATKPTHLTSVKYAHTFRGAIATV